MKSRFLRASGAAWLYKAVAVVAAVGLFLGDAPAFGYSPSHPKVQAMVAKARQFLAGAQPTSMGESALCGLAMLKSGSDETDPKVQRAVAAIRAGLQDQQKMGRPVNYQLAISIIFLCEIPNATQYRPEIQALLDLLLSRQEGHGGWSYWPGESQHTRDHGDSSMTQYGTLALWAAKRAGFQVPQEAAERVANFWMRSQTPQGAWSYQATVYPLGQRGPQSEVRPSIAVAGLSSCFVIGDLFGMAQKRREDVQSGQPSALQKVQDRKTESRNFPSAAINTDLMRQTMQLGERYLEAVHEYRRDTWIIYYMYGMERYRSFQEHYTGRPAPSGMTTGLSSSNQGKRAGKLALPHGRGDRHLLRRPLSDAEHAKVD
jgi:hypothetical protein